MARHGAYTRIMCIREHEMLLASPYLDILTEHYRFLYVYGILNQKTTKIDQIRNKDIADFTC